MTKSILDPSEMIAELPLVLDRSEQGIDQCTELAIDILNSHFAGKRKERRQFLLNYLYSSDTFESILKRDGKPHELRSKLELINAAFPWYDSRLYAALSRAICGQLVDSATHKAIRGKYRYYRYFPDRADSGKLAMTGGIVDIELDDRAGLFVFGHRSLNYEYQHYEHRGFVIPTRTNTFFWGYRDNVSRSAISDSLTRETVNGIVLSTRRLNDLSFSARFIAFHEKRAEKNYSKILDTDNPRDKSKRRYVESPDYFEIKEILDDSIKRTTYQNEGFIFGGSLV